MGIKSLDEVAVAPYDGLPDTQMGDRLRAKVTTGTVEGGLHSEDAILADIAGEGQGSHQFADKPEGLYRSIQIVYSLDDPVYDPARPDEAKATVPDLLPDAREGQALTRITDSETEVVYTSAYMTPEVIEPLEGSW